MYRSVHQRALVGRRGSCGRAAHEWGRAELGRDCGHKSVGLFGCGHTGQQSAAPAPPAPLPKWCLESLTPPPGLAKGVPPPDPQTPDQSDNRGKSFTRGNILWSHWYPNFWVPAPPTPPSSPRPPAMSRGRVAQHTPQNKMPPPQGLALIFIPAGGGGSLPPGPPSPLPWTPSPLPPSAQMHPKTWGLGTFFSHGKKIFGAFGACHTLCTYCSMCAPYTLFSRLPCPCYQNQNQNQSLFTKIKIFLRGIPESESESESVPIPRLVVPDLVEHKISTEERSTASFLV